MNGKYWEAVKKEIVRITGVAKDSLCDLIKGIVGFVTDNVKEVCVAADIVFIPVSCIYIFKTDYYRNHIVDKYFLLVILLVNAIFTAFVFYAVAKGKKSDYATWPAGLSVIWGIVRIVCINHGYKIPVWLDLLALAVCILSIPALVLWSVNKKLKNVNNVVNTEDKENS